MGGFAVGGSERIGDQRMNEEDNFDMSDEDDFDVDIFDAPDRTPDPRAAIAVATLKCLERLECELGTLSDQLESLADYHDEKYGWLGGALILRLASHAAVLLCDQRVGDAIREAGGWPETES
jgi:hypothetical protein